MPEFFLQNKDSKNNARQYRREYYNANSTGLSLETLRLRYRRQGGASWLRTFPKRLPAYLKRSNHDLSSARYSEKLILLWQEDGYRLYSCKVNFSSVQHSWIVTTPISEDSAGISIQAQNITIQSYILNGQPARHLWYLSLEGRTQLNMGFTEIRGLRRKTKTTFSCKSLGGGNKVLDELDTCRVSWGPPPDSLPGKVGGWAPFNILLPNSRGTTEKTDELEAIATESRSTLFYQRGRFPKTFGILKYI